MSRVCQSLSTYFDVIPMFSSALHYFVAVCFTLTLDSSNFLGKFSLSFESSFPTIVDAVRAGCHVKSFRLIN